MDKRKAAIKATIAVLSTVVGLGFVGFTCSKWEWAPGAWIIAIFLACFWTYWYQDALGRDVDTL